MAHSPELRINMPTEKSSTVVSHSSYLSSADSNAARRSAKCTTAITVGHLIMAWPPRPQPAHTPGCQSRRLAPLSLLRLHIWCDAIERYWYLFFVESISLLVTLLLLIAWSPVILCCGMGRCLSLALLSESISSSDSSFSPLSYTIFSLLSSHFLVWYGRWSKRKWKQTKILLEGIIQSECQVHFVLFTLTVFFSFEFQLESWPHLSIRCSALPIVWDF